MYGFSVTLTGRFDEVLDNVVARLKEQGFGVLTEIDVKATLKAKLDAEMLPYKILGACNPALAHRALTADPDIGLLLPCNVIVRQNPDNTITVGFLDPDIMVPLVNKPGVQEIAAKARRKLMVVRDGLAG